MSVDVMALGKVGVLFGGRSSEREVSIMSGTGVLKALQSRGVDAHAFDPGTQTLAELEAARFDRVFIALHGRGGEDGTIQGVLETLRVPYTGSGVQASAIAIDKLATKRAWLQEGIPTPRYRVLDERRSRGTECGCRRPRPAADHQAAARGLDDRHQRRSPATPRWPTRMRWPRSTTASCSPSSSSPAAS